MLNDDFARQLRQSLTPRFGYHDGLGEADTKLPIFQAERRHMERHAGLEHTLFVLLQRDDLPFAPVGGVVHPDTVAETIAMIFGKTSFRRDFARSRIRIM